MNFLDLGESNVVKILGAATNIVNYKCLGSMNWLAVSYVGYQNNIAFYLLNYVVYRFVLLLISFLLCLNIIWFVCDQYPLSHIQ